MKKLSIALLGSPALLATFLLSSSPVQAESNSKTNKDVDSVTTSVVITRTVTEQNNQSLDDQANILISDRVGDIAIQRFGCDCMGCRQAALQLFSK